MSKDKRNFFTTFGIFGSLASIIALIVIFLPKTNTLELAVTTSLIENLTDNKLSDPDLKAIYTFKGDTINNLKKIVLEFENKSNETFVISNKVRNVLTDTLNFELIGNIKLIDLKQIYSDFKSDIFIINKNNLGITFQQWRPNEKIKLFLYIQTNEELEDKDIFLKDDNRPIINGNIKYYYENENNIEEKDKLSFVPFQIRKIAYVLIIISFGFISIILFIVMIGSIIGYYKRRKWKQKELIRYNSFIRKEFKDDKDEINEYINNPSKFYLWSKYDGEMYPELEMEFNIEKGLSLFFAELFTIIGIVSMVIVIIDLIRYFP